MEFKLSGFSITIDNVDALSTGARAGLIHLLQLTGALVEPAANSCIAHEDRPDVGQVAELSAAKPERIAAPAAEPMFEQPAPAVDRPTVKQVPAVPFVAEAVATPIALVQSEEPTRDFAAIFGGASTSSVPVPPPPAVPMPTPPAPPAAPACSPASAPEATVAGLPASGTDGMPVLGAVPALDATGLPWDYRIHATTKGRTTDGAWRKRKNLDPSVVAAVEAELRTAGALPKVDAPPAAPDHPAANFSAFMGWVGKQIAAGALTHAATFDIVRPLGLQSLISLSGRPDLLPAAHAALVERMAEIAAGGEQVAA